jgi:hypothetical protein
MKNDTGKQIETVSEMLSASFESSDSPKHIRNEFLLTLKSGVLISEVMEQCQIPKPLSY